MTPPIDKGLPTPPPVKGRPRKYPFPDMAVGDSFAVPLSGKNTLKGEDSTAHKLRCSAMRYARLHGGKFTVRTDRQAGEARCWRVE
jgi:hypothetical protein